MKTRFILFRRGGVFYCQDTENGKQFSLRTKDKAEALTLLHSRNEAYRQPVLNLHIARTYLTATDPEIGKRTWQFPMDEMTRTKTGPTLVRCKWAMQQFFIKIKMPYLGFHCLRVTFVNRLRRAGVPREAAMRLVNHASDLVHQIYQREKVEDIVKWRDAVAFPTA